MLVSICLKFFVVIVFKSWSHFNLQWIQYVEQHAEINKWAKLSCLNRSHDWWQKDDDNNISIFNKLFWLGGCKSFLCSNSKEYESHAQRHILSTFSFMCNWIQCLLLLYSPYGFVKAYDLEIWFGRWYTFTTDAMHLWAFRNNQSVYKLMYVKFDDDLCVS